MNNLMIQFMHLGHVWWMPWVVGAVGICIIVFGGGWWWAGRELKVRLAAAVEQRTRRLEDVSRRFRLMADNAYDLIAICNVDGQMEYLNAAFTRAAGFRERRAARCAAADLGAPKHREEMAEILKKVVAQGGTVEASVKLPHVGGGWVDVNWWRRAAGQRTGW